MALQSFPYVAHFLTITEATFRDGAWLDDRSQAFFLPDGSLGEDFISIVDIRRKRSEVADLSLEETETPYHFIVYMVGGSRLYRAEFTVSQIEQNRQW